MAKKTNLAADLTMTLPGVPAKRGRPVTGKAMTGAQRHKKWRDSHSQVKASDRVIQTVKALAQQFDLTQAQVTRELLRFALCNKKWKQTGFPLDQTEKAKTE